MSESAAFRELKAFAQAWEREEAEIIDLAQAACAYVKAAETLTAENKRLREALKPFVHWARWALEKHPMVTSARTVIDVGGMLHGVPDEWSFAQQLSPYEPRLLLGHFRAACAAVGDAS